MPGQESLVRERFQPPSSTMTPYAMRRAAEGLGGVQVNVTVNRFCHVLVAEIGGLLLNRDEPTVRLCLCDSSRTRAYLVTDDIALEGVLADDWPLAKLSSIENKWAELKRGGETRSFYFVSVTACPVPETELEEGTAFRVPTQRDGEILHTSSADSVIVAMRSSWTQRLQRPEMEPPYVDGAWVALTALLSAARQGRGVQLGKVILSEPFHLSTTDEVVGEMVFDATVSASVASPVDQGGLSQLQEEVRATHERLIRRGTAKQSDPRSKTKASFVASLVEAILGEQMFEEEDGARLRYLRLWQALADINGKKDLSGIEELPECDASPLDDIRNVIAHPNRALPPDTSVGKGLGRLREAALRWVRDFRLGDDAGATS